MKTVLAPIDFSATSKLVVAEAVTLARAINARLVVLHVVLPPVATDSDVETKLSAQYAAMASESAAEQLSSLQRKLRTEGVTIETAHLLGFSGECIVNLAVNLGADYIVIGSHGHGAFYDLIVGSTTSRVLKQAECPVVVVPPGVKKTGK